MKRMSVFLLLFLWGALLLPWCVRSQEMVYSCNFDQPTDTAGWVLLNGFQPNYWRIGQDQSMTSGALYVSNVCTTVNYYDIFSNSLVYAYRRMTLEGASYQFSFDWRCAGERNYDFMRLFLVPDDVSLEAGTLLDGIQPSYLVDHPEGWIGVGGSRQLFYQQASAEWQHFECEQIIEAGTYKLVFVWNNDRTLGSQPPAAVDNLLVVRPACPVPAWPYVSQLTPTSFNLHWSDLSEGNATQWLVELDSASYVLGLNTSYDTVFGFSGLQPSTDYTVRVWAVCGADTLDSALTMQVQTPCALITQLPYRQDFESLPSSNMYEADVPCWTWTGDDNSQYITEDENHQKSLSAIMYPGDYVIMPGVDPAPLTMSDLQFSFLSMRTLSSPTLFEVGVLSSPMELESFERIGTLLVDSTGWARYVMELTGYYGSGSYIALKLVRDVGSAVFVYFDDVEIGPISACQSVHHLRATHTGTTGTMLEWQVVEGTIHEPDSFEVVLERADGGMVPGGVHRATAESNMLLTGLEPGTGYVARVRVRCANDSLSGWDSVGFGTMMLPCMRADSLPTGMAAVGTGTHLTDGVPVHFSYDNTQCQSVFTATELLGRGMTAGVVTGMDYSFTSNATDRMFSIYLTAADIENYSNDDDMVEVCSEDLVYGPAVHPGGTSGTVHYTFARPFTWDGVSNIVVTSVMNAAEGVVMPAYFSGHSTAASGYKSLFRYRNSFPLPARDTNGYGVGRSSYRPSVKFYMSGCAEWEACVSPTVWAQEVEEYAANLAWTAGRNDTCWSVYYREVGDSADGGWQPADTHVMGNGYRLESLEPAHQYEVRLEHVCGGDTFYGLASFVTLCTSIESLPWEEDFERLLAPSEEGSPMESCWYRASNVWSYPAPYVATDYAYDGEKSLCFFSTSSNGHHVYISTPDLGMDVTDVVVSFYVYETRNSRLKVGVMDDPTDFSTFTEVAEVSPSRSNEWEFVEVPLDQYAGAGRYVALAKVGIQRGYIYVDHLRVEALPFCSRPLEVEVRGVTHTAATLGWRGRNAQQYEVEYGPRGFAHGGGSVVASIADSVVLTGLNHSTRYDVYVRSICGESDTSIWSFATTLTTTCGLIEHLPYTVGFTGDEVPYGECPVCWTCGSTNPELGVSTINRFNSAGQVVGRALRMPMAYNRNYLTYAVLPQIDTATYPIHTVQLVVKASSDTATVDGRMRCLVVGVASTNESFSTYTPVDTLCLTEEPTVYEVSFDEVACGGSYITLFYGSMGPGSFSDGSGAVYIDSVAIDTIPGCRRPTALHATTATTTTATLAWEGRGRAMQWQVEYMPHGAAVGSGVRLYAAGTMVTVTGLAPNTVYDFYVRGVCGAGDTSEWSHAPATFVTQQIPATAPYNYAFDTSAEWDDWKTFSNTSASWYRGMADGQAAPCMYISADSGGTRSTHTYEVVNAVAYRDIDFGPVDTSYILSFSASVGGRSRYGVQYDGLAVFLADPAEIPASSSHMPYLSPWGSLDDLTLLADIRGTGSWGNYSVALEGLTGVHRLVFYWFNHNQQYDDILFSGEPAAVDNISIYYNPCPAPRDIHVTRISAATATIVWRGNPSDDYHVRLESSNGTLLSTDTVHTNSIQYTYLTPGTAYRLLVEHRCGGMTDVAAPVFTFSTDVCADGFADTIGNPSEAQGRPEVPLYTNHPYSYTQQLVLASELGGAGEISSINFQYVGSRNVMGTKTNCTIYMGHTTLSSFSSVADFVSPEGLEMVYVGTLNCYRQWNRFYLDKPFAYNGMDNLVVAIDDNSGEAQSLTYNFSAVNTPQIMTYSFYSDNMDVDCSSDASLRAFAGSRYLQNRRALMSFDFCSPNNCPSPTLCEPEVQVGHVTLSWLGTSDRYMFGYRMRSENYWVQNNVVTTDTFYVIQNFIFDTDYVYHVRQFCDTENVAYGGDEISNWAFGTFNTGDIPCLPPTDLRVSEVTHRAARLTWTPDGNNISYRVHVWGAAYDTFFVTYLAGGRVNGLNANTRYYVSVEVVCEYHANPSRWSDTVSFVTDRCPEISGLTALEVGGNSVLLDWTDEGGAEEWRIEWGPEGFEEGTGVTVMADHHPYLVTGLTGETTYDIYVRAVCGTDFFSDGWGAITVTTQYSDVGSVTDDARVTLSPNPTRGGVVLALPGRCSAAVRVEVVDGLGRVRYSEVLPSGTTKTTLPTSQLEQGAYIVRLVGSEFNAVKRLLVD